ncbi:Hypothetical protein CINCED_3A002895 [Cinara cedri]|uniref:Uncharacterized protein n=1 Tax=Cinara cedri TaxID=506608 RepID=A0A5E4NR17_9HEMI|nr:Hypothetical protein CINCED_3A002895 [Cinara cedri]
MEAKKKAQRQRENSNIVNNNYILLTKLLAEDDEDDIYFANFVSKKIKSTNEMFKYRDSEGCYEILIIRHLKNDDIKFHAFFRSKNHQQFYFLLSLVENELILQSYNRVKIPITSTEKLAVILRYLATGESIRSLPFSF